MGTPDNVVVRATAARAAIFREKHSGQGNAFGHLRKIKIAMDFELSAAGPGRVPDWAEACDLGSASRGASG